MLTLGGVSDPYIAAVPEAGLLEFKTVDGVPELPKEDLLLREKENYY